MRPSDLPVIHRAALTYHPEIGMFGGKRGAWRVHHCFETQEPSQVRVWPVEEHEDGEATKMLYIDVPSPLRANIFVNPTVLLKMLLEQRRSSALLETATRVWEGPQCQQRAR